MAQVQKPFISRSELNNVGLRPLSDQDFERIAEFLKDFRDFDKYRVSQALVLAGRRYKDHKKRYSIFECVEYQFKSHFKK